MQPHATANTGAQRPYKGDIKNNYHAPLQSVTKSGKTDSLQALASLDTSVALQEGQSAAEALADATGL